MTDNPTPEETLAEEFRQMGKNLADVLRGAWESPERKKLQQEIADGLSDLSDLMRSEAEHIRESPTGKRVKADVEELHDRIRSREIETRLRQDVLAALRSINTQLRRVSEHWSEGEGDQTDEPAEKAES